MEKSYIYDRTRKHNQASAHVILPFIFDLINPRSVVDFGCGLGNWLSVAKSLGAHHILGVDRDYVVENEMFIPKENFMPHNLCEPLNLKTRFDLAICVEVAEHLPEECAANLVSILVRHTDTILFSAALPHQGGQRHVNEQPLEYWRELFQLHGFSFYDGLRQKFWNNSKVKVWYRQNCFLVSKNNLTKLLKLSLAENSYVHPGLFNYRVEKLQEIVSDEKSRVNELRTEMRRKDNKINLQELKISELKKTLRNRKKSIKSLREKLNRRDYDIIYNIKGVIKAVLSRFAH